MGTPNYRVAKTHHRSRTELEEDGKDDPEHSDRRLLTQLFVASSKTLAHK